jgi:hypothetical protein
MSPDALRDPTAESSPLRRPQRDRLPTLTGAVVGLVDIGKMRGDEFVDRLEERFAADGIATRRYRKPTNTRVAPVELLQEVSIESHAVVLALSD